ASSPDRRSGPSAASRAATAPAWRLGLRDCCRESRRNGRVVSSSYLGRLSMATALADELHVRNHGEHRHADDVEILAAIQPVVDDRETDRERTAEPEEDHHACE